MFLITLYKRDRSLRTVLVFCSIGPVPPQRCGFLQPLCSTKAKSKSDSLVYEGEAEPALTIASCCLATLTKKLFFHKNLDVLRPLVLMVVPQAVIKALNTILVSKNVMHGPSGCTCGPRRSPQNKTESSCCCDATGLQKHTSDSTIVVLTYVIVSQIEFKA